MIWIFLKMEDEPLFVFFLWWQDYCKIIVNQFCSNSFPTRPNRVRGGSGDFKIEQNQEFGCEAVSDVSYKKSDMEPARYGNHIVSPWK